jgi:oligoendopeptidase F
MSDNLGKLPQWNLSDLYESPNSDQFNKDFEELQAKVNDFEHTYKGNILLGDSDYKESIKLLKESLKSYEDLINLIGKLSAYSTLYHVTNTGKPDRTKFYGDTHTRITEISNKVIFYELELNKLPDDILNKLLTDKDLIRYKPWFENIRKYQPHQLTDELEKVFQDKSITSFNAWNRLFDQTISNMKVNLDGNLTSLEEALNQLLSNKEEKRKAAFLSVSSKLQENISLFTHIMNTICQDKAISDKWRKYSNPEQSRHLANNIEPEVINALVGSVERNYKNTSHRYYALKAKLLNKTQLESWDRNAPLPDANTKLIDWNEAKEIVIEAYEEFSVDIAIIVKKFFDNNWIDARINEGKVNGAFAHPVTTDTHPYILLNYQGKPRDVMTLAHELGHGVHQVLASDLGPLLSDTPLTLAETASVFGEMLTYKKLVRKTENNLERKILLASKIEDMINTVVRQISFFKFEQLIHQNRKAGELTGDDINNIWIETQSASLGPAINMHEQHKYLWAYIPHFIHSPFYVYAYAFGDCLVNSLYSIYENQPSNFVDKYMNLLSSGGSKHHKDLLRPFGLDASDPNFWDSGISLISRMIDELEKIS